MFEKIIQKQKELQEEIEKFGKEHFAAEFKKFFDTFPQVEAVRWYQYTPHFNDGDPCRFGVGGFHVLHVPGHPDRTSVDDLEDWERGWTGDRREPAITAALAPFNSSAASDVLEAVFGDGVLVTATRDGFDVQDYDHD